MLNYTFGMIKAPTVARGQLASILTNISKRGYSLSDVKRVDFTEDLVRLFYAEHVGKPYFQNVIDVMTNPAGCVAFIAQLNHSPNSRALTIDSFRRYMGQSSNPNICSALTLRGTYGGCWWGGDPTVYADNAVHGSDSESSVLREVKLIYPEGISING